MKNLADDKEKVPEEDFIVQEIIIKPNGDKLTKNYKRGALLGKGGFAAVFEFFNIENKQVLAGKVISKHCLQKARARQKLMFEIKIHRALHHQHIVSFERYFEDADNIYILLELCQNQTMNELLRRRKRLTELEVQSYLAQMVSALKYLHSHRVIHRDIKLGNLFLNNKMEIKLGDFGLATKLEFDGERKRTICGTPNYIAPEILDGKEGHSYEVDLWSLGVLLYTLSVGRPPFETHDIKLTYKRIRMNAFTYPDTISLSEELKDLISKLIVTAPLSRLPLDEVLQHPFMKKNLIPKNLPPSTLACPPSETYQRQFMINSSYRSSREIRSSSLSKISDDFKSTTLKEDGSSYKSDLNLSPIKQSSFPESKPTIKESNSSTSRKIAVISNYSTRENSAKISVKKWVDYSSKYGLGYLLSDGTIGIYFNDSSKLVCTALGTVQHIYKTKSGNSEITEQYKSSNYPQELKKKMTLLEHFRKYLLPEQNLVKVNEIVYVKKWLQTDHATVFRLSDKTVQVRFLDKTELVLSTEFKTVAFIDKSGICEVHPLKSAVQSDNKELSKRINYTTEMITMMLNPKGSII